MSNRALIDTFNKWRDEGEAFALVTVVETAGSTYSKQGRHLLIRSNGEHEGLLSGGCLEGDLAQHARAVIESGEPKVVTYDMRDDADDLWGIGLGCNGMMRMLVQRVAADNNWEPLQMLTAAMNTTETHMAALIVESKEPDTPVGTCWVDNNSMVSSELPTLKQNTNVTALHWKICPWTRLLLLGAGPDAVPVVESARMLGWEVTVADHRPHYIDSGGFDTADARLQVIPADIAAVLNLGFNAIVVMSHHLETDRLYLQQLAALPVDKQPDYVGILGPPARKQKLLDDLGDTGQGLANRLRGPVGLDLGADSPATIALSLISEIQAVLNGSSGNALSNTP
ncbi:MAG: XdhC family protein [Gammaproteobacteria bacterium]|jgi:xanthine/CO dehydrogenase XdhC/CoxF family maturation factor|nr:XdhC family protein [Gammaproteobacteria bacterium]MDP6617270.1 XdhC family protein [Gammaproteobacteria bacterium]MDP6694048.1 XdhC family protein [Gammaproteobacteria bacterium]